MVDDTLAHPQYGLEEDLYPATSEPTDLYGTEVWAEGDPEITDYGEEGGESVIDTGALAGLGLSTYLTAGIYNADFLIPPANPFAALEDANPLPYWRAEKVQGNIALSYTAAGSVKWDVPDYTTTNDETYIEQIVPIVGTGVPAWLWLEAGTITQSDANLARYARVQFYDADGVATSAEKEYSRAFSSVGSNYTDDPNVWAVPATDDRFMRVRIGVKASAAVGQANDFTLERVWRKDAAAMITDSYFCLQTTMPGTGTNGVYLGTSGQVGARFYITPYAGWVIGVGARASSARSTGNCTLEAWNSTQGATVGSSNPRIDSGSDPQKVWDYNDPGEDGSKFLAGDRMRALATGSGWTPTSADIGVTVLVMLDPAQAATTE